MPAEFNTEIVIGDTRRLGFPVVDLDADQDGDALANLDDLETAHYVIVEEIETGADPIVEKTLNSDGMTVTTAGSMDSDEFENLEGSDPVISVLLTPSDTENIPTTEVQHELQLMDSAANIVTVMQGNVEPIPTAIDPRQS